MIVFPNCKINLGLSILDKRRDGYHNIQTIFYPLAVRDAVEAIPSLGNVSTISTVDFTLSGLPVYGDPANNLCVKAFYLLQKDYPRMPSAKIHLLKSIPMGAGLGGGSADGAFTLQLLNRLFHLELSQQQLIDYASRLGSDCPFFIINKSCYATGRGEILEPLTLDLSTYSFFLVNCGISINTGWAFSFLDSLNKVTASAAPDLKQIITGPINTWKELLVNDFEAPVFQHYPEIKNVKDNLYEQGALYAAMTGSGSTVFGIFEKTTVAPQWTGRGTAILVK